MTKITEKLIVHEENNDYILTASMSNEDNSATLLLQMTDKRTGALNTMKIQRSIAFKLFHKCIDVFFYVD